PTGEPPRQPRGACRPGRSSLASDGWQRGDGLVSGFEDRGEPFTLTEECKDPVSVAVPVELDDLCVDIFDARTGVGYGAVPSGVVGYGVVEVEPGPADGLP